MPESEIRNLKSEIRDESEARRRVGILVAACATFVMRIAAGLRAGLRSGSAAWFVGSSQPEIRLQKYRVAPRLGTDTVRRRILRQLRAQTALAITETNVRS
jgi:hypothetical protein